MTNEIEFLIAALKKSRKYAAFFEWPDKKRKELGIVEELIKSLGTQDYLLTRPLSQDPDPPDCICTAPEGNLVAMEVVELVSQDAVERCARGENVVCWWEPDDIRANIESLLSRKDRKRYHGGPYSDVVVVIHTDEPALSVLDAREALDGVEFGPFDQLTRAFLLFSYMPDKGYEVLALPMAEH